MYTFFANKILSVHSLLVVIQSMSLDELAEKNTTQTFLWSVIVHSDP